MNFLPTNYQLPKTDSHYFRLETGDNTFRVLSPAVIGWKYWEDDKGTVLTNPVKGCTSKYVQRQEEAPAPSQARHFWIFAVWNYAEKQVQLLEITQSSIMNDMQGYIFNEQWGDPQGYDFNIKKRGEGLSTEYQVTVNPKQALEAGVAEYYANLDLDLDAFFRGEDPFKAAETQPAVK